MPVREEVRECDAVRVDIADLRDAPEREPNLLAVLQSTATTTQRRVRTTVTAASVKTRERLAQRTTDAAPWPKIPSPYDELLIVNVVAGPLELCWR